MQSIDSSPLLGDSPYSNQKLSSKSPEKKHRLPNEETMTNNKVNSIENLNLTNGNNQRSLQDILNEEKLETFDQTSGDSQRMDEVNNSSGMGRQVEHVVLDGIHRDLVNLVNLQRDKLTAQQVQLTQFEAEITYLEGRWREDQAKVGYVNAEMERLKKRAEQLDAEVSEEDINECKAALNAAVASEKQIKDQLVALQRKMQECDSKVYQLKYSIQSLENEMTSAPNNPPSESQENSNDVSMEDNSDLSKQVRGYM